MIINNILDQINKDFQNYFCYGNEIICEFDDSVSAIEHYYFKTGKLTSSFSNLNCLFQLQKK